MYYQISYFFPRREIFPKIHQTFKNHEKPDSENGIMLA